MNVFPRESSDDDRQVAGKLERAGVLSAATLLERCRTPGSLAALARETGLGEGDLRSLAERCDLGRISEIKPREVELLLVAGVHSVISLAKNDPSKLLAWLREVNAEAQWLKKLPNLERVVQWVREAKGLCQD